MFGNICGINLVTLSLYEGITSPIFLWLGGGGGGGVNDFLTFLKDKIFCFNEKQQLMENECFEREPFWSAAMKVK